MVARIENRCILVKLNIFIPQIKINPTKVGLFVTYIVGGGGGGALLGPPFVISLILIDMSLNLAHTLFNRSPSLR